MTKEYFRIAVKNLRTRPLRSWLTILGIVIGIFLIMSLLSLSEGLKETVLKQLRAIGKDILMVIPGDVSDLMTTLLGGVELTDEDLDIIRETKGVEAVIPFVFKGDIMRYQGETKTVILYGIDWKNSLKIYQEDLGFSLDEGRWPHPGKREIIVGSLVPEEIFPELEIGTEAIIQGRKFEIVGVLKSLGSKQDDSNVVLDLDMLRDITGKKDGAAQAIVKVKSGFSPDEVAEDVKDNLLETRKRKRGEEEPSFSVLTNEKITGIISNIMGVIQVAVFAFASIAIIVGGIGIMNTMYTSVHERTKEIGILKAVGAKKSTIISIFLIESGIIGLVGGLGGMVLGLGLARAIEAYGQVHPIFYISASITPGLVIFGLVFSFLLGCISGFLPAKRAASFNPVDALRYE
jgi:putative ABC transport system permease protein